MSIYQQASLALSRMGADAMERKFIVRSIIESDAATFSAKFPLMANNTAIRKMAEAVSGGLKSGNELCKHAARTSHPNLRQFIAGIAKVCESVRKDPSPIACDTLIKNHQHCKSLLEDLRTRRYDDRYTRMLANRLHEDLAKGAKDLVRKLGTTEPSEYGEFQDSTLDPTGDLEADHESFVTGIEKALKCQVHHWEPWREGVVLFMDEDNTAKVMDQLRGYNDVLEKVTHKLGYVLLRRGDTTSDIQFGSYGEPMSRWLFIRLPAEVETWLSADAMEKLTADAQKEADRVLKKNMKGAEKLPLATTTNPSALIKATKPLASIVAGWDRA